MHLVINFVQEETCLEVEHMWIHGKQWKTELLVTFLERERQEVVRGSREEPCG